MSKAKEETEAKIKKIINEALKRPGVSKTLPDGTVESTYMRFEIDGIKFNMPVSAKEADTITVEDIKERLKTIE
jgi:hypothetical protein